MKKVVWMAIALSGVGIPVHAQTSVKDSMKVVNLQEPLQFVRKNLLSGINIYLKTVINSKHILS